MKKYIFLLSFIAIGSHVFAQTNTFPATGKVGIGTTSPTKTFEIVGSNTETSIATIRTTANIISETAGLSFQNARGFVGYDGTYKALKLTTSDNGKSIVFGNAVAPGTGELMRLTGSGRLGLGNSAPASRFHISETSSTTGAANGMTIEQSGTGDAAMHFLITSTARWTLGIDNSDESSFKIGINANLASSNSLTIKRDGNVGIGTTAPTEKLSVKGKIRAQEIKVELTGWADYVFAKDYKLPTLQETEKHIMQNGHLPGIPSAAEVAKNGIELGEMNKKLLQKIEELTLYLIDQNKSLEEQSKLLNEQQRESNLQKARIREQNEMISAQNINIRKLSEQLNKLQINQTKKTE